jgi:hypothetical protein
MPTDSLNSLADFDLCLALAQRAINSQMEFAWKAWKRRVNFQDTIKIYKTKKDGQLVDAKTGITAKISPLTIDLNLVNAKLAQVLVTLPLASGSVKYFDEEEEGIVTLPFEDWSVSFVADLEKKPVDLDILRRIDPDTHRTAAAVIARSGLPDSVFSIEYLFLKFTKVDLMLSDNKNVHIPASVPQGAREKALANLNFLLQGELGDFMLGTVVRRNNKQSTPTFALTDFIFNVHPHTKPEASTLAYLGMLSGRPMPANLTIARTRLEHPWLAPELLDGTTESVSGVMAISQNIFMEKYIIPKFSRLIGSQPVKSGLTWTYSGSQERKDETTDLVERNWETGVVWSLSLTVKPGTNTIAVAGRIASRALMDGYTLGMRGKSAFHSEWIHMEGHKDLTGQAELIGSAIAADFKLNPKLTYKFGGVAVDNDSIKGGAVVLNALEVFSKALDFSGATTAERLSNSMNTIVKNWSDWLEAVLKAVDVDLTNHAFIPPGGGVFTFSKPRFTPPGDLMWNVIYIAP